MALLGTCQAFSPADDLHPLKVQTFGHLEQKDYQIGGLVLGTCVPWWTLMGWWKWLVNLDEERVAKWTR